MQPSPEELLIHTRERKNCQIRTLDLPLPALMCYQLSSPDWIKWIKSFTIVNPKSPSKFVRDIYASHKIENWVLHTDIQKI